MDYILLCLLGPLDRLRGSGKELLGFLPSKVKTALYGLTFSLLYTLDPVEVAGLVVAFLLGESFGWGCPLGMALSGKDDGCELEWYQSSRKQPWEDLFIRGVLWGIPLLAVGMWFGIDQLMFAPAIFGLSMVLAPAIVRASIMWKPAKHLWAVQEYVRGWLIGVCSLLMMGVL